LQIRRERLAAKVAAEEKERLQQQLFQSQKIESIGRLAGGIAHDFNNLLTGIMGYASLSLRSLPPDSAIRDNLDIIIEVSKRASHLIRQLLLFSRKIPLELKATDVNQVIRETVKFIGRIVEEAVEIKLDLQEDIPTITSDEGQLTQLLINLAVNARDAMQRCGMLTISTRRYPAISNMSAANPLTQAAEHISISVADNGCGIPKEHQAKIFDPFFTTKEVGQGTGLGLAIVYSIVNSHGGWINLESAPGQGTTFQIFLPVQLHESLRDGRPVHPSTPHSSEAGGLPGGGETILVVEDEDLLRTYFTDMLQGLGYTVLAAENGQRAFDLYQQRSSQIDLVVSDMIMPKMSGIELFNRLRTADPAIKFILVTGYCLDEIDGGVLREMSAVLMKPYTTEKIALLIRGVLNAPAASK